MATLPTGSPPAAPPGPEALAERLAAEGARLRPKAGSRQMRLYGVLLRLLGNPRFQAVYWTTMGRTIYYPTSVTDPLAHPEVLEHELIHVGQWRRYGLFFSVSYLLLPVPVLFAWWRWRWEREAYLVQLRAADDPAQAVEWAVGRLWKDYAFPWPKAWMRRWFRRTLGLPLSADGASEKKKPDPLGTLGPDGCPTPSSPVIQPARKDAVTR